VADDLAAPAEAIRVVLAARYLLRLVRELVLDESGNAVA
jgi:hypothetical protein